MAAEERKQILDKIDGAMSKLSGKDMTYLVGFGDGLAAAAMMETEKGDSYEQGMGTSGRSCETYASQSADTP